MLIIIILFLTTIIIFLSLALVFLIKKILFLTNKEKEFIIFVIDVFIRFGDDLGIQTKEQHLKLTEELNKIKTKLR